MPLPLLAQLGIAAGTAGFNYLTSRKSKDAAGINPADYKSSLLYSPGQIGGIRGSAMDNILRNTALTEGNIKQVGAATRAPGGAILDSLAGANYQGAKAGAAIEPQLAEMQHDSILKYLSLLDQYKQRLAGVGEYNRSVIGDTVGTLGKLAALYNSGYFENGNNGNASGSDWSAELKNRGIGLKLGG